MLLSTVILLIAIIFSKSQNSLSDKEKGLIRNQTFFGASGRIRTGDLFITSELLYRLSHTSKRILFYQNTCNFATLCNMFF